MIKLVYCVRKRDDVSADEFYRYWLDEHGPLVRSFAKAIAALRYVQSHTVSPETNAELQASRGLAPPYEGITEVWWNSPEDMAAALGTKAGIEAGLALIEDEARFVDFSRSSVFMTEEHEIFDYR